MPSPLSEIFKNLKVPFHENLELKNEKKLLKAFALLEKWRNYYLELLPKFSLLSYDNLETPKYVLPKLKEITQLILKDHESPSPSYLQTHQNYSPKIVRQTAMRILYEVSEQTNGGLPKSTVVSNNLPSPLASMFVAHIVPRISYEEHPAIEKTSTLHNSYHRLLSLLSAEEMALLCFYYHQPSIIQTLFQNSRFYPLILEIKIALELCHNEFVRSHLIYGKWNELWIYGYYKRMYQSHHGLLGAMGALGSLASHSLSALSFHLLKANYKLNWQLSDCCEGISFQKHLHSSLAPKFTDSLKALSPAQQGIAIYQASSNLRKTYYQCPCCYTLYSHLIQDHSHKNKNASCSVCHGYHRVLTHYYKNDTKLQSHEKVLLKAIIERMQHYGIQGKLRQLSYQDILTSLPVFEEIHQQSWGAYKKLAFQVKDDKIKAILLTNFVDNLFTYKYQTILPLPIQEESLSYKNNYEGIEKRIKNGQVFLKHGPWSRIFLKEKPKTAIEWIQSFLFYLTFPFPPSSLYSYKTYGDVSAHLQSNWRGIYIADDIDTYHQGTQFWSEDILKSAKAYNYNPFYIEKPSSTPKPLRELSINSILKKSIPPSFSEHLEKYLSLPKSKTKERLYTLEEIKTLYQNIQKSATGGKELSILMESLLDEEKDLKNMQ